MKYVSTRGTAPKLGFEDTVLAGMASDGGLYLPETFPKFSPAEIASFAGLSYSDLAFKIMEPFIGDEIPAEDLKHIIDESYKTFRHAAVTPLSQLSHNSWLLELYHGKTLAFKDIALQFLGRALDYILKKRGEKICIVGATSGDTGSAAIAGCRGRDNMDIFILHPHERVSEVQRRQMTTVLDSNVHNIAIKGTFDDAQAIVKAIFADNEFSKKYRVAAVNSINWARIMAQVVYYFYAALSLGSPAKSVIFSVPTGNFGDIYAGYVAKQMGLPIEKLIVATNRNNILARFFSTGTYKKRQVHPTISPSMDIQVSSNFERLLFDMHDRDGSKITELMKEFEQTSEFSVAKERVLKIRRVFDSAACPEKETKATIKKVHENTGRLIDPHTAVGIYVSDVCYLERELPVIQLATAHPTKFPDSVKESTGCTPELPDDLSDLFEREERCEILESNVDMIKEYISTLLS